MEEHPQVVSRSGITLPLSEYQPINLQQLSSAGAISPGVGQGLLVAHAGALDHLSEGVEHLAGHADGLEEVGLAGLGKRNTVQISGLMLKAKVYK